MIVGIGTPTVSLHSMLAIMGLLFCGKAKILNTHKVIHELRGRVCPLSLPHQSLEPVFMDLLVREDQTRSQLGLSF